MTDIPSALLTSPVLVAAIPAALALVAGRHVIAAKDERIASLKEAHEAELRARDAQLAALERWSPESMQKHVEAMKQVFEQRVEQLTDERDSIQKALAERADDERERTLQVELEASGRELAEAQRDRRAAEQASEKLAALTASPPRAERYRMFFTALMNKIRMGIPGMTASTRGQAQSFYIFPAGRTGFGYNVEFLRNSRVRVGLYLDTQDKGRNKSYFDLLAEDRTAIEADYGEQLNWERWDDKQACMILVWFTGSIDDDLPRQDRLQDEVVEALRRFRRAFGSRILALPKLPVTPGNAGATPNADIDESA